MACAWEGASCRLCTAGCYASFVHGEIEHTTQDPELYAAVPLCTLLRWGYTHLHSSVQGCIAAAYSCAPMCRGTSGDGAVSEANGETSHPHVCASAHCRRLHETRDICHTLTTQLDGA